MKYFVFCAVLLLVACSGPITKEKIRDSSAYSTTFNVDKPYQQAFANVLEKGKICYLNSQFKNQLTFVGNRNNANKTANIALEYVYAMADHDVVLMVDFLSIDDDKTKVTVYTSRKKDKRKADVIRDWAMVDDVAKNEKPAFCVS